MAALCAGTPATFESACEGRRPHPMFDPASIHRFNKVAGFTGQDVQLQDVTPPELSSATIVRATRALKLTYNEAMNTNFVPAASAFMVTVDGTEVSLAASGPVAISGSTVTLTLAAAVVSAGSTVVVT